VIVYTVFFLAFNVVALGFYLTGAAPDRHTDHEGVPGYVTVACEAFPNRAGAMCRGTFRSADDGGMVIDHVEFRVAWPDRDVTTVEAWATGTLPEDVHPQGAVDERAADNLDAAIVVVVGDVVLAGFTLAPFIRRRRPA